MIRSSSTVTWYFPDVLSLGHPSGRVQYKTVHSCTIVQFMFILDLHGGYLVGTRFRFRSVASVRARYRLRKSPTRTRKTGYAHRTHHTTIY